MRCMHEPLQKVIEIVGLSKLGSSLGVRYQSVLGWRERGRLPRTEWTGETNYAEQMEKLTAGAVTRDQLLDIHSGEGA